MYTVQQRLSFVIVRMNTVTIFFNTEGSHSSRSAERRPFTIMLAFFSAFFVKTSIFFSFFLEKELLLFSVIFHDCDPDFSGRKGVFNPESLIQ